MENERSVYWNALRNIGEQPKTDSKKNHKRSDYNPTHIHSMDNKGLWQIPCSRGELFSLKQLSHILRHSLIFLLMSLLSFGCKTLRSHIVSYRLCCDLKQFCWQPTSTIKRVCWAPRANSLVRLHWQGGRFEADKAKKTLEAVPEFN